MLPSGNFLLIPEQGLEHAQLFELGDGEPDYCTNCLVAIPYSEPRIRQPQPVFYRIRESKRINCSALPRIKNTPEFIAKTRKEDYIKNVSSLLSHIQRGNIYEINYCMKFSSATEIDPLSAFLELCAASKAPYQFLARLNHQYILCASPELFLKKSARELITKPIKGTISRGATPGEDERLKNELSNSPKDRSENIMAIDVARNDLSIVAAKGSVVVNSLCHIEWSTGRFVE